MIIKRMTARFGKLSGDTLNLSKGLNVIIAPNEGGKTTWSGFIRTMLYGMDQEGQDSPGMIADRNRFAPWDGSSMEGEMVVEWGGDTIVLARKDFEGQVFSNFKATSKLTGKMLEDLSNGRAGEALVGASEDVFLRSAFIGHGGNLAVNSAPDLERRMAALVSSGQEDVSYAMVDDLLEGWLRYRRHGKNGLIPKLEEELVTIKENRNKLLEHQKTLTVLLKDEEELSKKIEKIDGDLSIYRRINKQDVNSKFVVAKAELEEMEGHHKNLVAQRDQFLSIPPRAELLNMEESLIEVKAMEPQIRQIEQAIMQVEDRLETTQKNGEDSRFPLMNATQAMAQIDADLEEIRDLERKVAKSRSNTWKHWVMGLVCGVGVSLGGFSVPSQSTLFGLAGGFTFICVSGFGVMMSIASCKRKEQQLDETYNFYEVATPPEIRDVGTRFVALQDEIATLNTQISQSYRGLDDMRKKQREGHEKLLDMVNIFAPSAANLVACGDAITKALRVEEQMEKTSEQLEQRRAIYQELLDLGGEELTTLEELVPPKTPLKDLEMAKERLDRQYETLENEMKRIMDVQEALGDLVALSAREAKVELEVERRRQEYRAVAIARKGMERAADVVQQRFYPELNRMAGEYFTQLTGGKYQSLSLSRELEAFIAPRGDEPARSSMALSQGTVDQIYLAVRLAVADLCLSKGELSPIILDDALISFDQHRMEFALDLLAELGQKRQIILFSCHGREGKYLANDPKAKIIAL